MADVQSLSSKHYIRTFSNTVSIPYIFSCVWTIISCVFFLFVFCMPHNFLLQNEHFKQYNVATLEIRFFPFPEFVVVVCLFSDFSE